LSLRLYNFRNLAPAEVNLEAQDIFLTGKNGQGKSNFLEALYFCSYGSSFRGAADRELPLTGTKECSVQAALDAEAVSILIKIQNDKKTIVVNGKNTADRKELLSLVPCIVFCHEDMSFITGSPEQRRTFFDQNLCLNDIRYLDDLRRYRKILKTRNALLKDLKERKSNSADLLDALDPQLAAYGERIMEKRACEIKHFAAAFGPFYETVSGIPGVDINYRPSWKQSAAPDILTGLRERREREIFAGVTMSGPHRDNYIFTKDGADFSGNASTGQKRLLALLLRTAQASRCHSLKARKPVLLLDDVLLELDGEKKIRFLSVLPEYAQAFYTFLPEEPFRKYKKNAALIYKVENGTLLRDTE